MTDLLRLADTLMDVGRRRPAVLLACIVAVLAVSGPACGSGGGGSPVQPSGAVDPWLQSERLDLLRRNLHTNNSGAEAHALFPDLVETFVDDGHGEPYNPKILPFRYYWSPSGRITVAICAVGQTVLICPYHLNRLITREEFPRCDVADIYRGSDTGPPGGRP